MAQQLEPIRVVRTVRSKKLTEPLAGVYVFDIGQNMAGWARLHVSGPRAAISPRICSARTVSRGVSRPECAWRNRRRRR